MTNDIYTQPDATDCLDTINRAARLLIDAKQEYMARALEGVGGWIAHQSIDINTYQNEVSRTCAATSTQDQIDLSVYGLPDEVGEIIGPLKKARWGGHPLDIAHIQEEIGDVLWYLLNLCNALDIDANQVLAANVEKLRKRYPDGGGAERSVNREEATA